MKNKIAFKKVKVDGETVIQCFVNGKWVDECETHSQLTEKAIKESYRAQYS